MRLAAFAILPIALAAGPALAGPAADLAKTRIDTIAKGDVAAILSGYAGSATLHWVGGPLDGTYASPDRLKEVWTKFATAQGLQTVGLAAVSEAANPKGATVAADMTLTGKATVKVRYVMVYRDGKVVDEIWQVNPNASY